MSKVHKAVSPGRYACGVGGKRWPSVQISSVRTWAKVTCRSCLRSHKQQTGGQS